MATLDDVARMASELPEVTEGERYGNRTWSVGGKAFAWDRPFSKADIRRFGDQAPPGGPILAVRVEDQIEKEAVLAANPDAFFTIPHFDGYSAVLIQLPKVSVRALRDAITDAWLACAPPTIARQLDRLDPLSLCVLLGSKAPARPGTSRVHTRQIRCIKRAVGPSESARRPRETERGARASDPAGRMCGVRPAGSSEGGFPMDTSVMFLDCPAYMNQTGSARCGLPAEVQGRYTMRSTDGPLESARIRCPRGHFFNGPVESLTLGERTDTAAEREAIARLKDVSRRPGR